MEINGESTKYMLLIFSAPGGKGECFVRDGGKRGKDDQRAQL
jgi:hypothetical protein